MQQKNDSVTAVKTWLFPAVVTILSTVIWQDIKELKNDVKQLLAQSNIDKTRIDALQKQIDVLNQNILQSNPLNPTKQANYFYGSKEFILTEQKKKKQVRYI
jgi:hypothetical protein